MLDPLSDEAFAQAYDLSKDQSAADKHLRVRFFVQEFEDKAASAKEGRPIFRSDEMCEIRYGDKNNVAVDRVRYMVPDPRKRFPVQYARFKAGEKVQSVGTPLLEFGQIPRSRALEYKALEIHTVEELAGLSDTTCQGIRGSMADRQKALDFLDQAKGAAPLVQARAELEALREELRALKDQMRDRPAEDAPKRRGRPPKVVEE